MPWPFFLLMTSILGIGLIIWSIRTRKDYPKTFTLSIILASITCMLVGIDTAVLNITGVEYTLTKLIALVGIPVIPLLAIGAYQKTKDDPERRKLVNIGIAFCVFGIVLLVSMFIIRELT